MPGDASDDEFHARDTSEAVSLQLPQISQLNETAVGAGLG